MADVLLNAVTEVQGVLLLDNPKIPYLLETVVFVYTFANLMPIIGAPNANLVYALLIGSLRAFGSYEIYLPFFLSILGLPRPVAKFWFSSFEDTIWMLLGAWAFGKWVWPSVVDSSSGGQRWKKPIRKTLFHFIDFCYAVVKGNLAAFGFVMATSAASGVLGSGFWASLIPGCFGAFLAVNGHRMLESGGGMAPLARFSQNTASTDGDQQLGLFCGLVYWGLTSSHAAALGTALLTGDYQIPLLGYFGLNFTWLTVPGVGAVVALWNQFISVHLLWLCNLLFWNKSEVVARTVVVIWRVAFDYRAYINIMKRRTHQTLQQKVATPLKNVAAPITRKKTSGGLFGFGKKNK